MLVAASLGVLVAASLGVLVAVYVHLLRSVIPHQNLLTKRWLASFSYFSYVHFIH